jgi:hypothetical protein
MPIHADAPDVAVARSRDPGSGEQAGGMIGHQLPAELDMPTWREDALRGAALGMLIFLGVALLLGGVVYWL